LRKKGNNEKDLRDCCAIAANRFRVPDTRNSETILHSDKNATMSCVSRLAVRVCARVSEAGEFTAAEGQAQLSNMEKHYQRLPEGLSPQKKQPDEFSL